MKKTIIMSFLTVLLGISINAAPTYEYRRELREGARGKWTNLRQHLNSGKRLEKELTKVDKQIDKKVNEIQEIENLLFRIEQYKVENNVQ
jgi:peptidoglycan hydrolase CwlO-like protein